MKLREEEVLLLEVLKKRKELSFKQALELVDQEVQEFEKRIKAMKREGLLRYSGGKLRPI